MAIKHVKRVGSCLKVLELLPIVLVLIMLYVKFAGNNFSVTLEYITDAVLQSVKQS